jgi:tRNA(adenine34) deaminase
MPRAALASQICCAPALRHAESVPRQEEDDIRWMRLALQQAQTAFDADEVPIGAIIVCNGELISSGQNMTERKRNPLCHAELQCILAAAEQLQAWRLQDATLYCTIEPCPMCAGAMLQARLQRLVYGGRQPRLGADGSWVALFPQQNCTCLQGGMRTAAGVLHC